MLQHVLIQSFRPDRVRYLVLAALLAAVLLPITDVGAVLANQNKRGLRAFTIEGVLRLQEEDIDLGTAALILSREWGTTQTLHSYRRKIDDMAEAIQKTLKDKNLPTDHHALPVINAYLFDELEFHTVETADDPEDLFLHVVLDRKRGYCLSLSILYLSVAERLGLPMYGVVVPGHFFVRYDDGRQQYNIETTSKGALVEDQYYLDKFKPPDRPQSLYMKNLTRRQTLGCFYNNLGNSYTQVGQMDLAFAALERAVQLAPQLGEAHTNLGNMYLRRQMSRQAVAEYEKALSLMGQDVITFNNLGTAWLQLKEYRKAETSFKTALSLDAEYIEAYRNLAIVYQSQGFTEKAITQLQAAIVLRPQEAVGYLLMGQIYLQSNNTEAARKNFETALTLEPGLVGARMGLGAIHLERNEAELAAAMYQTALAWSPNNAQAYFGLAQSYHALGQTDSEIMAYQKAIELEPHMTAALQNLGNAWMAADQAELAATMYRRAIETDPVNPALHYNLGVAMARQELHQDAIAAFSQTISLDPGNGAAYNGLAISYYRLGDLEQSYTCARKAKSLGVEVQNVLLQKRY